MHPRDASPVAPADMLTQTLSDCNADRAARIGAVCDPNAFVSSEAAICAAQAAGLEPGLAALDAGLLYDSGRHRVAWGVTNLLYDEAHAPPADGGSGTSGGRFLDVDAVNLSVLLEGNWLRIP